MKTGVAMMMPKMVAESFGAPAGREKKFNNDAQRRNGRGGGLEDARQRLRKAAASDGGRLVSFGNGTCGALAAGVEKNRKLSFLWLDKDRKVRLVPTKTRYHLLKTVPGELSVLRYMLRAQRNDLIEIVKGWLEENPEYELVGEIGIHPWKPRTEYKPKRRRDGGKGND